MRWRNPPATGPKALLEPPTNPYAPIYQEAAELIREHGWCPKGGVSHRGEICILVAITQAASRANLPDDTLHEPARRAARFIEPKGRTGSSYSLIAYNDSDGRTEAEILGLLDQLTQTRHL